MLQFFNKYQFYFFLIILFFPSALFAETLINVVYVSSGAGYDDGIGLDLDYNYKFNNYGFDVSGQFLSQKKHEADYGFKYNIESKFRWYLFDNFYTCGGASFGGYDSKFPNDSHWIKNTFWPVIGFGYNGKLIDSWISYYLEENQTENNTSALKLGISIVLWKNLLLTSEVSRIVYTQGMDKRNDIVGLCGLGLKF